jgi:hypothetical protein
VMISLETTLSLLERDLVMTARASKEAYCSSRG